MSKPVEVEFLMKDKLTPGMNKAEREALELRNTVRLLEAELERLRLAGETAAPNLDQSANIAQIHALEKQLEELRGKLKLLQEESESVQVTPADVPNAQRQLGGLHNSIQQIAREMPSLAMGPQMFFLAISNNLPIFTDELARARKEYDELQKSGKKGTPVWKQVLSSLFSWQTAMTTGIMLLVMYGDEIWDWTKNLFSAKKGVDEFNISLKEMTEIEKDGRAQMVRTRFELKSVIDEIKNFTGSKEQEKAKVERLGRRLKEISEEAQGKNYFAVIMKDGTVLGIPAEDVARSYAESQKAIGLNYEFQFREMMKSFDMESYQFVIWARRDLPWRFIQEYAVVLKQPERDFEKEWREGSFQFIHDNSNKEMQDK